MTGCKTGFGILVVLLLGVGRAYAWYQVEAIVFEYLQPDFGGEFWDSEPGLAPLTNTVIPVPTVIPAAEDIPADDTVLMETVAPTPVPYMIMPEDKYRLGGVYRNLRLSRQYRPIYHLSWQQPAVDGNEARAVHLQEEDTGSLFELTIPPALVTDPMPAEFYEPIRLIIDGTVRVRSSNFLHVDVDMVLFRQPPYLAAADRIDNEEGNAVQPVPPAYVRLQETRRIRLNELHYFDHPMFGVILQVSRYLSEEER